MNSYAKPTTRGQSVDFQQVLQSTVSVTAVVIRKWPAESDVIDKRALWDRLSNVWCSCHPSCRPCTTCLDTPRLFSQFGVSVPYVHGLLVWTLLALKETDISIVIEALWGLITAMVKKEEKKKRVRWAVPRQKFCRPSGYTGLFFFHFFFFPHRPISQVLTVVRSLLY